MAGGAIARFAEPADHDVLSLDHTAGFHEAVELALICSAWVAELCEFFCFLSATSGFVSVFLHNLGEGFGACRCLLSDCFVRRISPTLFRNSGWCWFWRRWLGTETL